MATDLRVWFCTPDKGLGQVISNALGPGFEVRCTEEELTSGLDKWSELALLDLRTSTESGSDCALQLMAEIRRLPLPPPIIVILPEEDRTLTLIMMEGGAYDVVYSPPDILELRLILKRASRFRELEWELAQCRPQESVGRLHGLIGQSEKMQGIFALAKKIAACDVSVLITGETGTGKELLARAIHQSSPRASQSFVAFSCANLPETLVEDELFGHEKGAFTGAVGLRRGRIEIADRGTLFLDEIGDLGLALQPKLLRVLQERTFERLGSSTPVNVNLRVICATNRNLGEMIQQGKFREDLYYRLNVVELHLPPLRERRDDIPVLAYCFLERFASQFGKKVKRFSRLSLQAMEEYNWPGNVRELENVVQRVVVLSETETVEVWQLPPAVRSGYEEPQPELTYEEEVRRFKRRLLVRTLRECGWRKAKSARTLGVARGYLHRLMHQLEISEDDLGEAARGISD